MSKELLINTTKKGSRIALLNDRKLIEYHQDDSSESDLVVGDIYLGVISHVAPHMNAAFVNIGQERDGFLHYSDLGPQVRTMLKFTDKQLKQKNASYKLTNLKFEPEIEKGGQIKDVVKQGQHILVQVAKEPISTKGARLTCEISLAGRYLVLVPFSDKISLSRKISSKEERRRLTRLTNSIKPKNFGVVVRTVALEQEVAELDKDLRTLADKWEEGIKELYGAKPGAKVVGELDRTTSLLRDMLNDSFDSILVDTPATHDTLKEYVGTISPDLEGIVKLHSGKGKLFETKGVEKQLKVLFGKSVSLACGGYLVIEHTEAMHVIDVNSGGVKTRNKDDQEESVMRVNMEAADEVARQLRLRDIGGIIVVDFIDMRRIDNRKKLYEKMKEAMKSDKAKHSILPLSKFGVMQITRQRVRPVLPVMAEEVCPTCNGTGKVMPSIAVADQLEENIKHLLSEEKNKWAIGAPTPLLTCLLYQRTTI